MNETFDLKYDPILDQHLTWWTHEREPNDWHCRVFVDLARAAISVDILMGEGAGKTEQEARDAAMSALCAERLKRAE